MSSLNSSQVRTLRAHAGRSCDALNLRLNLVSTLARVDFCPSSISAHQILCVRRLAGVAFPLSTPQLITDSKISSWQNAVREKLDVLAARAGRPTTDLNCFAADAVLFADTNELLACLARDWLRGDAIGRWWWQSLFPGHSLAEAVAHAFTDKPKHVPAAMDRLQEVGLAGDLLRALPARTVAAISLNVARTFALEELQRAVTRALTANAIADSASETFSHPSVRSENQQTQPEAAAQIASTPPWIAWVQPEPMLSPEAQSLLVISIMLIRRPAIVRSLKFLKEVRDFAAWRETGSAGLSGAIRQANERPRDFPSTRLSAVVSSKSVVPEHSNAVEPAVNEIRDLSAPIEIPRRQTTHETACEAFTAVPERQTEVVCSTGWGGIFYLVNVALALGLYGDFTQPRKKSLPLPVWDFLALLGRRMIGSHFEADPIWNLLAILSGRDPHEPPGAWFEPARTWLPEPDEGGRSFREDKAANLVSAMRLEDWVERLACIIDGRLAHALNQPDRDALHELVFHHAAEVRATWERVTVRFSLAAHPITLRIAGLDRDPGWVPAAGRAIYFQYD